MSDSRSSIDTPSLNGLLNASTSVRRVMKVGAAQYQTPVPLSHHAHKLLPSLASTAIFDPQCAAGNLFLNTARVPQMGLGCEIDPRFGRGGELHSLHHSSTHVLTANCVDFWALLDEVWPQYRFRCQVANPPFFQLWKVPDSDKGADSTLYTWRKLLERTCPRNGYGFLIANADTIERLGIHAHDWVYLYQRWPVGLFPEANVEIGVVHWWSARPGLPLPRTELRHETPTLEGHRDKLDMLQALLAGLEPRVRAKAQAEEAGIEDDTAPHWPGPRAWQRVWEQADQILEQERHGIPPYHIYLDRRGHVQVTIPHRVAIQRKLSTDELLRLASVKNAHPLALTTEAATRRLMQELIDTGAYTIQPECAAAIRKALDECATLAVPIMPPTDFELVAYADELDYLTVRADYDGDLPFTAGRRYPSRTGSYTFTQSFRRNVVHYSEEEGTQVVPHECSLSGTDRYIAVTGDDRREYRFMDRPGKPKDSPHRECPESLLWTIFQRPTVPTVLEVNADKIPEIQRRLGEIEQDIAAAMTAAE